MLCHLTIVCSPSQVKSHFITIWSCLTLSSFLPRSAIQLNLWICICFFLFVYFFNIPRVKSYNCPFLSYFHLAWYSEDPSMSQLAIFYLFLWLSRILLYIRCHIFVQSSVRHRLFACLGYCEYCCNEHRGTYISINVFNYFG